MKFRKKPVTIEAERWFQDGDHNQVEQFKKNQDWRCKHCSGAVENHGFINTLEGGHIVCPGDYIIEGVKGEFYPCKPDIFVQTYEPITGDMCDSCYEHSNTITFMPDKSKLCPNCLAEWFTDRP